MPGGLFWLQHQAYQSLGTATPPIAGETTFTEAVAALSPTAHWTLGEASGTTANDETGTHDGTYLNTPTLGVSGWSDDGTGITLTRASQEGVQVPDHADNDLGTSDFSILLAVDMGTPWYTSDYQAWFAKGAGNPFLIGTNATADRLSLYLVDTSYDLDLTTDLTDGWHLVLITADRSGSASVFVDGVETAEDTVDISAKSATDLSAASDLYLGISNTSYPFGGSLQHVAYWKGTLVSGAQFATLYAARNGTGGGTTSQAETYAQATLALSPVAYYKLDEASGSVATDSSTTGNDATVHNSPTMGVAGPFEGASGFTLNGSSQWLQAPYSTALDFSASEDLSMVAWIKQSTWDGGWLIGRSGGGYYDDYELYSWTTNLFRFRITNAAETAQLEVSSAATTTVADAAWHMVALTLDRDGNAQFYLDGSAYGTATDISAYQHALEGRSLPLYIGRSSSADSYLAGSICQVAVFPSALSSGDISGLWTAAGN